MSFEKGVDIDKLLSKILDKFSSDFDIIMMEVEDRIVAKVREAISAGFDRLIKSRDNHTLYSSDEKLFSTRISFSITPVLLISVAIGPEA